jgi:L-asparaginase II
VALKLLLVESVCIEMVVPADGQG